VDTSGGCVLLSWGCSMRMVPLALVCASVNVKGVSVGRGNSGQAMVCCISLSSC